MIDLMPGDFFCTNLPGNFIANAILAAERFYSKDNQAELSHSGIIVGAKGTTLEALWTVKNQNVWKAYGKEGIKLLIGRHTRMTPQRYEIGRSRLKRKIGDWYPLWKLPLFYIPFIPKYLPVSTGVCSELTMEFLYRAGLVNAWRGWTPDDVADYIVKDRQIQVVYHQNITSYDPEYLDSNGEFDVPMVDSSYVGYANGH